MWLMLDLPNMLFSFSHHLPHMFVFCDSFPHKYILFMYFALIITLCGIFFLLAHHFTVFHTHFTCGFFDWRSIIIIPKIPPSPPPLTPFELVSPPPPLLVLQSTCDTLRSHSDSLGFTPNMLPRHPTLGNFEEFAC